MSGLHIIRICLNVEKLVRFAQDQGINTARDEDMGYAVHAWITAAFGDKAPKPYRIMTALKRGDSRHGGTASRGMMELLGYTGHALAGPSEDAPGVARASMESISRKTMPVEWRTGAEYDFEVLACPITRRGKPRDADTKTDNEKDAFLRALDNAKALGQDTGKLDRRNVYCDWLVRKMGDCVAIKDLRVDGFRRVSMLRKTGEAKDGKKRGQRKIERPLALFKGTLEVRDGEKFSTLLTRGVGRHRAFGCGMILLTPPR